MTSIHSMSSGPTIWAFDLGIGSIGEAIRLNDKFIHTASLLIPAEFAETKSAAGRRRMWRTRQAHKARERWLQTVVRRAGIEPLIGRQIGKVDRDGKPIAQPEWTKKKGKWVVVAKGDYRLEREFAPKEYDKDGKLIKYQNGMAKDGAPASTKSDFETCYTSCLLRIKLLRGEKLAPWQIYKALHSSIQKRGYGKVPWAARDLKRTGKTEEDIDKELANKDATYREAVEAWPKFKNQIQEPRYHFPCYYDAAKMGLWEPEPDILHQRITCYSNSTRRVRFDRADVEKEIAALGDQAAKQLPELQKAFDETRANGWMQREETNKREKLFPVVAKSFGEFLVHGPAGEPPDDAKTDFSKYLVFRRAHAIHPGSADDWMGATAQKIPRFDNRIINDCALIDGLKVCSVNITYDSKHMRPDPNSMLASEVTFLMKLKNTLVSGSDDQRKLTCNEIKTIFEVVTADALAITPDTKDWSKKVAERFSLTKTAWGSKQGIKQLQLRPLAGHEIVKSPKIEGRSRFSRPALRLIRALILSGQKPSEFRHRLLSQEQVLLDEIGMDVVETEPIKYVNGAKNFIKQPRPWVLIKHLRFLEDLSHTNDTWESLHIPEQRLDVLEARHTNDNGNVDRSAAIRELLGNINNPVVRHRLGVFAQRLNELHKAHGIPSEVVLEFVREDFMGEQAKRDLRKFQNDREKSRKDAQEKAAELGASERSASLKFELFKAQGSTCLYCGVSFAETELVNYEIEHIVPRSQGGPDAMVNYVLAHQHCNDNKDDQTPFQWKHGRDGWDSYERLVKQYSTTLRNKKVQLLLREDAPTLVQRYTALAETAWISKLAQKIISLHFGWKNGIDYSSKENPVRRVTVISGGLTGRIRRKYKLNSLLNPPPPGTIDIDAWETTADKNRDDDRHHALDAMVISFLPTWARDAKKEYFFRFPEPVHSNAKAYFGREIEDVRPKFVARSKPALETTFYGTRKVLGETFIVKRRPLADLATKELKGKLQIKPVKDIKPQKIIDITVRTLVEGFLESHPQLLLEEWLHWCRDIRLSKNGPHVQKVLMTESEPDSLKEYSNFSKSDGDSNGQYLRAATHFGYFVITLPAPKKSQPDHRKIEVHPVFAFQTRKAVANDLRKIPGLKFVDYFSSNCQVTIAQSWNFKNETFPAGEYTLKTIKKQGNVVLKHGTHGLLGDKPKHNSPIGIRILVEAGMRCVGSRNFP